MRPTFQFRFVLCANERRTLLSNFTLSSVISDAAMRDRRHGRGGPEDMKMREGCEQ